MECAVTARMSMECAPLPTRTADQPLLPPPAAPAQTRAASEGQTRELAAATLDQIAAAGFSVIRVWAFNDGKGWNALQTAPGGAPGVGRGGGGEASMPQAGPHGPLPSPMAGRGASTAGASARARGRCAGPPGLGAPRTLRSLAPSSCRRARHIR